MRYRVNGHNVDAERAALSSKRSAKWLLEWIAKLQSTYSALDYGCGRLRYSLALAKSCRNVTVVDSRRQFSRSMVIHGHKATIPEYITEHCHNVDFRVAEEFSESDAYDVALCINVLSSIPNQRSRNTVLKTILASLKGGGIAFFANQHRNSYFRSYQERQDVTQHFDGWLIPRQGRMCFYGLIHPNSLARRCKDAGYEVTKLGCNGDSGYVVCTRRNGQQGDRDNALPWVPQLRRRV